MARTLPNLGLKAFFARGEDNWNTDVDSNFLRLSTATQCVVENLVGTKPSSPPEGSVYLLNETEDSNPNSIAVFDDGVWKFVLPRSGWIAYDKTAKSYRGFDGTKWNILPLTDSRLLALSGLDSTSGLLTQTGAATFTKTLIGDTTPASIPTLAHTDARYAGINHTHPNSVQSFNGRVGSVGLTADDVKTALSYNPMTFHPILDALTLLGSQSGIIEQTGPTTFSKRAIGISNSTDLLSRGFGDARYTPLTAISSSLAVMNSQTGLVEQTTATGFAKRKINEAADPNSLLSVSSLNTLYARNDSLSFLAALDTPSSFTNRAGYLVRVNQGETALEFVSPDKKPLMGIITANNESTISHTFNSTFNIPPVVVVSANSNVASDAVIRSEAFVDHFEISVSKTDGSPYLITGSFSYFVAGNPD